MKIDKEEINTFLPTGKPHVSFSEIRIWKECSWKHKLMYIDKIVEDEPSVYLEYGTLIHEAIEKYILTKDIDIETYEKRLKHIWARIGFDKKESIEKLELIAESQGWKYRHEYVDKWVLWLRNSLNDIGSFLDSQYPNWELIAAEEPLYENIDVEGDVKFKGYIDCILKYKKGKKDKYVIIDWKTASPRGWSRDKKTDIKTTAQLTLYKHYWAKKYNIPLRDIACNFVLIKRGAKPGKICSIVEVSAGEKTIEKANKLTRSMIKFVKKGMFIKNRNECKFCPYSNTDHCV